MAISNTTYTYFVSGKVYFRQYGSEKAFEFPGLVDQISLAVSEQVVNLQDRTAPGGGNYDQVRRIESASLTMAVREFRPTVLEKVLFGTNSPVASGTESAEEHVATKGGFIPLDHPGPYTNVSVTDDATSPQPIGQAGNYEVVPGGIQILEDATDIDDDDVIRVTYTYPDYQRVEALTSGAPELELIFVGQNEARNDSQVRVRIHRVRLGAPTDKQLLSADDFGSLDLTGEVLKDTSITAQGSSQYWYEDIVG